MRVLSSGRSKKLAQIHLEEATDDYLEGRIEEAFAGVGRALDLNPRSYFGLILLANLFNERGRFQDDWNSLQKAACLKPNHPEAYFHLSVSMVEQKRFADAESLARQALFLFLLKKNKRVVEAEMYYENLVEILLDSGKKRQAQLAAWDGYRSLPTEFMLNLIDRVY